jgi:hypothetical protein
MVRGFQKRSVVAVLTSGLLWVAPVGVGCGPAEDVGTVGNQAEADAVFSAEGELRRRIRRWPPTTSTTTRPQLDGGTTTTSPTPAGQPTSPETTPAPPNTGVVDSSNSGGTCPNNRAMSAGGACGPYGINCTYDDSSGSHFCICLNAGPTGVQGWSCR